MATTAPLFRKVNKGKGGGGLAMVPKGEENSQTMGF